MPIEFDKTLLAAKHVLDAQNFVNEQKAKIARLDDSTRRWRGDGFDVPTHDR
jgi:hypothetical protein